MFEVSVWKVCLCVINSLNSRHVLMKLGFQYLKLLL